MKIQMRPLAEIKRRSHRAPESYTKAVCCPECRECRQVRRDSTARLCKSCACRRGGRAPKPSKIRGEVRHCIRCRAQFWYRPSEGARRFCSADCANAARRRADHDVRAKARWTVNNAIRDGVIQREPCEECGGPNSEAHHEDYSQPLAVRWLCRRCHCELHTRNGDLRSRPWRSYSDERLEIPECK
jgi:hypothetical protein